MEFVENVLKNQCVILNYKRFFLSLLMTCYCGRCYFVEAFYVKKTVVVRTVRRRLSVRGCESEERCAK
jgi:hypothetical protein